MQSCDPLEGPNPNTRVRSVTIVGLPEARGDSSVFNGVQRELLSLYWCPEGIAQSLMVSRGNYSVCNGVIRVTAAIPVQI